MNRQELITLLCTDVAEFNRQRPMGYIDLSGIDLSEFDLHEANLTRANLYEANLSWANLTRASLSWADVTGANLYEANLSKADLSEASLPWTSLHGTNLCETVLDPANKPNADVDGFERDGEYIVGYRTKYSDYEPYYETGLCYHAPYFSTCETECHPGLYLFPSIEWLKKSCWGSPYVKVWAKPELTHKAGNKWRTKCFFRVEDVESDYLEGRNNG